MAICFGVYGYIIHQKSKNLMIGTKKRLEKVLISTMVGSFCFMLYTILLVVAATLKELSVTVAFFQMVTEIIPQYIVVVMYGYNPKSHIFTSKSGGSSESSRPSINMNNLSSSVSTMSQ